MVKRCFYIECTHLQVLKAERKEKNQNSQLLKNNNRLIQQCHCRMSYNNNNNNILLVPLVFSRLLHISVLNTVKIILLSLPISPIREE